MFSPAFSIIIQLLVIPLILVACGGKKKAPQSTRTSVKSSKKESTPLPSAPVSAGAQERSNNDVKGDNKPSAPVGGGEGAPKKDEGPVVLERGTECIDILLTQRDGSISEEYFKSMLDLEEKVMQYAWAMKKRLAADEASWKELSKKISKLLAEGFCVRAGSEEAKKLRRMGEVENKVEQQLAQHKKRKKGTAKKDAAA